MHFCGAVEAWLKSNQNMNETGIVNWCRLRDLPSAPIEKPMSGRRYWQVNIPLEILFLTESVYA